MRKLLGVLAALLLLGAMAAAVAAYRGSGPVVGECRGAVDADALRLKAADGNCLQAYLWAPAAAPRAVLVVVHGLHDHARRYQPLARALNEAGIAVLAIDHRGHGGSGGAPQRLDSVDQLLADVGLAVAQAHSRFPGAPVVLYGHSLGGMVAAQYAARHGTQLAGAVISSAALKLPAGASQGQVKVVSLLSALAPGLGLEAVDEAKLVREPTARSALAADALIVRDKLPARTLATLLNGVLELQPRLAGIDVPLLVLHGLADTVTDPAGSTLLHERAASARKTLRTYPAALHDLLHEPEGALATQEIVAFVSALAAAP
jgi:acylglycerol lipase